MRKDRLAPLAALVLAACSEDEKTPATPPASDAGPPAVDAGPPAVDAGALGPGRHSLYVTADDGTRIAVFVWLPEGVPGKQVPIVLRQTRYWRAKEFLSEEAASTDVNEQLGGLYVSQGFAYVSVDVRGTGASFGTYGGLWSSRQQIDTGNVLDWLAAQPWSAGRVFPIGVSYDGNTAVLAMTRKHPTLAGVVARFYDYDPYAGIAFPGGLYNAGFVEAWAQQTRALDANDHCTIALFEGLSCMDYQARVRGPLAAGAELASVFAGRTGNLDPSAAMAKVRYRDDALGAAESLDAVAPYRHVAAIGESNVPMLVTASWLDGGTAAGALDGYRTLPNAQSVIIGAFTHGGIQDNDPLSTPLPQADPPIEAQYGEAIGFFAEQLGGAPAARGIRYVTLGERVWRTTETWPPASVANRTFAFASGGALSELPAEPTGHDVYAVDLTATTGPKNRWTTPLDLSPVAYGDRAVQDAKLLTYTTPALAADMRVTGTPMVKLQLSVDKDDAAVIVYLEDVDATGASHYVTEGLLRLRSRATGDATIPGNEGLTGRTYRSADASAMPPNVETRIDLPLQPTSALFRAGHRLRIAIAGADAGTFAPATAAGTHFTVRRGAGGSTFELPVDAAP